MKNTLLISVGIGGVSFLIASIYPLWLYWRAYIDYREIMKNLKIEFPGRPDLSDGRFLDSVSSRLDPRSDLYDMRQLRFMTFQLILIGVMAIIFLLTA